MNFLFKKVNNIINGGDFSKAKSIIPYFYYSLLAVAFVETNHPLTYLLPESLDNLSLTWPVFWIDYISPETGLSIVLSSFVVGALIGAFFYRNLWGRLAAFIGILFYVSFIGSVGVWNQLDHWLWPAFFLIFIPDIWKDDDEVDDESKNKLLSLFWITQALLLLIYTMSAIGKLYGGILQVLEGSVSIFSINSAALHAAGTPQNILSHAPLSELAISLPILSWVAFWIVIYIQASSFYVAFKPRLHKLWGVFLVLFHISTAFFFRATFVWAVPAVFLFLVKSPFGPNYIFRKKYWREMPIVNLFTTD